jgi:excisionase family DNA binding protein
MEGLMGAIARFLTVSEVATSLSVSERQVWRLIRSGQLVAHKFGGCTRISSRELDQYIDYSRHNLKNG